MSRELVFISGSTGFIGAHVVKQALEKGYRVRLSVRREEQVNKLKTLFSVYNDKIETVVIPDLTNQKVLEEALVDVAYVLHLASPMPLAAADLQTGYIHPSVNGVLAVLEATKATSTVKRLVITSSAMSLMAQDDIRTSDSVVEEGTNPSLAIDLDNPLHEGLSAEQSKYHTSKLLMHRRTLEWVAEHKPAFDVITVHPVYVIGHDLWLTTPEPRAVNAMFLYSLTVEKPVILSSFVDVRDVAALELAALTADDGKFGPKGTVTEFLAAGPYITWQEIANFVRSKYPGFPVSLSGPFLGGLWVNTTRASRDLGIQWRTAEEAISTVIDQQLELGEKAGQ